MIDDATLSRRARALGAALEPFAAQVYFSPECHANYVALGFSPSPGDFNGVAAPDGPAYFTSRGAVMGQVSGEVVASAFAVFNPEAVVPSVNYGWTLTDAPTIAATRDDGAIASLARVLGAAPSDIGRARELLQRAVAPLRPEGRPLFSGLLGQPMPDTDLGAAWRLADMLREYRGDSHTAAWISENVDATQIGMLSELYWGLPMRSYGRTRAWSDAQFDAAERQLVERGLVRDGAFTDAGRALREAIETATDRQMRPAIEALGDDLDELIRLLTPWGAAIREARGYPAAGPHDLADAATS